MDIPSPGWIRGVAFCHLSGLHIPISSYQLEDHILTSDSPRPFSSRPRGCSYGHRCPTDRGEFFIKIFGPAPYQGGGLKKEIMKNLADNALTAGGP